jgi:RNA polymerase sigma-70 factor (ECF subfamily)
MNQVYGEIERYIPQLRRYARSLTHNPVAAEDLVQDTLLRALVKCRLFRPGTNLGAWLFTILHNEFVSDVRRQSRFGIPVDIADDAVVEPLQPDQESRLVVKTALKALDYLPSSHERLLRMVAIHGLSYEEAAQRSGLPVGTVKSRISRARSTLRDALM